jgi:hypothetical protein
MKINEVNFKHPSLTVRSGGDFAQGDSQTERSRSLGSLNILNR